ncbi:MAG: tRNA (adenosine(37)-N6)-threonylcarbamoyltransferase complex ATPase subunit type 1 TsaE [Candidatus Komeilibacteria bacterium]|nr:tRNA (adenosine(37)-N6)-threonylcarbamoyltransferase complex ATPase subunit type 1 TsaE [Candidatus Komeilibacteria bacterium]
MTRAYTTTSPAETEELARKLASDLRAGTVIALEGELGAGKTVFVKGIAKALGITTVVQSPTFVLMKVYEVQHHAVRRLVHVDCYRLDGSSDLRAVGLEEYLHDSTSVVVIEWADKVPELVPHDATRVRIRSVDEHERTVEITSPDRS